MGVVVCAFFAWTGLTSGPGTGYYDLQADAFLDGHAALPVAPAPELLALPDPYDPALNQPYRLHDASLYDGHYYLYFGPTPVVLVYLPLRAVGVRANDPLALVILACAGFLLSLALLRFLVARYRPRTSIALEVVAGIVLGLAGVLPFLLRRPAIYEVAIAGGYACLMASLYLTLTGALRARPCLWRIAGGSLALGLAAGARPHLVLAVPVLAWAWWRVWRARDPGRRPAAWTLAAALGPLAACLVLLAVYNAARFDSVTEFGARYQLAAVDATQLDRFSLGRLVPGLFFYLLDPPKLDGTFPFAHLAPDYPGTLDPQYTLEPVAGVFATTSIALIALLAPVLLWRARRGPWREGMLLASLLLLSSALVLIPPMLGFDAATMRYEVDFVPLLLLAAVLVVLRLADRVPAGGPRRLAAAAGAVACAWAVFFGLAFSITGYADLLRVHHPGQYDALERVFTLGR